MKRRYLGRNEEHDLDDLEDNLIDDEDEYDDSRILDDDLDGCSIEKQNKTPILASFFSFLGFTAPPLIRMGGLIEDQRKYGNAQNHTGFFPPPVLPCITVPIS